MSEADVYEELSVRFRDIPKSKWAPLVLKRLVTPGDAQILLELPAFPPELAQRFNMGLEEVNKKLAELTQKGVAVPVTKGGQTRYYFPRTVYPELHDNTITGFIERELGPNEMEILRLWQMFKETELYEDTRVWEKFPRGWRRVIPMIGAVKDESVLLPQENLRYTIEHAPAIILAKCTCRPYRVLTHQCPAPLDTHLSFSTGEANYWMMRGAARKISQEEAFEVVRRSEEAGLVPNVHTARDGGIALVCHCCSDCCVDLHPLISYGYNLLDKSRFQAAVNVGTCNGCQDCVERCLFGAIEMRRYSPGKKLKAHVDAEKCYGCGSCVIKCAPQALSLKVVRPPEYLPKEMIYS